MISRSRLAAVTIRRRFLATVTPGESLASPQSASEAAPTDPVDPRMHSLFTALHISHLHLSQAPL
jgi:hypothetical protein